MRTQRFRVPAFRVGISCVRKKEKESTFLADIHVTSKEALCDAPLMPARLRGVNVTAATRFETRYVTRANLATRYTAPHAAQFNARVESTSATDTGHFASSLAPTTRGEGEKKKKRERERTAPAGCIRQSWSLLSRLRQLMHLPGCAVCISDVLTRSEYA